MCKFFRGKNAWKIVQIAGLLSKFGEGVIENQWFTRAILSIVPRPSHGVRKMYAWCTLFLCLKLFEKRQREGVVSRCNQSKGVHKTFAKMPFCAKNYGIFEKNCAKIDVFCANACVIKNILLSLHRFSQTVLWNVGWRYGTGFLVTCWTST